MDTKRLKLIQYDGFEVELEYNEDSAILHLPRCEKLTKEILLTILDGFDGVADLLFTTGYRAVFAAAPEEDRAINKLIEKLNMKYLGNSEGMNIYVRENPDA